MLISEKEKENETNSSFEEFDLDKCVREAYGKDPNVKLTITQLLNILPEKVGREFLKRANVTFGTKTGEMACYDCLKERKHENY